MRREGEGAYAGDGGRVTSGRTYQESKEAAENEDGREGEKGGVEEKTRFIVEGPARSASKERKHGQKGTVPKHQACVQNSRPGVQEYTREQKPESPGRPRANKGPSKNDETKAPLCELDTSESRSRIETQEEQTLFRAARPM